MPDLKDILAPLGEYAGEDEEKQQEAANELHKLFPAIADVLIARGAKGKRVDGEAAKKLREIKAELQAATEKNEELTGLLEDAQSKKPEEVQKIQKELDKAKKELEQATNSLVKEKGERITDKRSGALERFKKHTKPGQAGGVQEGYDEDLAAKHGHLITYAEDGTMEVHKIDDPETVYTPAKGQDALELLAADAVKKAPTWARLTGIAGGGGQGGGGRSGDTEMTEDKIVEEKLAGNTYRTF